MASKFYRLTIKPYARSVGELFIHSDSTSRKQIDVDGLGSAHSSVILELRNGQYADIMFCPFDSFVVSDRTKNVLEKFISPADNNIRFIPIQTISKEHGDRTYFIIDFTEKSDLINKTMTIYAPCSNNIIIPCLDYDKVKDLEIFSSKPFVYAIFISDDVMKALKKAKATSGYTFSPITVSNIPTDNNSNKNYYRPVLDYNEFVQCYNFIHKTDCCPPLDIEDSQPVKNLNYYLEKKGMTYSPFAITTTTMVVSKEFRDVLLRFIPKRSDYIEFLPVQVKNDTEGDRIMYIPHFTKVLDVLDEESTLYIDDSDYILLACVDYRKVKNLHVFKALSRTQQELILSEDVVNALEEAGLTDGYTFLPQYVSYKNE